MMKTQTDISIARGFGSTRSGVSHWLQQRFTAVLLLMFTPWVLWVAIPIVWHIDQFESLDWLDFWYNKLALVSYIILAAWHGKLGIQVVVEDYVHSKIWRVTMLFLISTIWMAITVFSVIGMYALD